MNHIPNGKHRILAISDIHGSYDEFIELLDLMGYDSENDQLILLGDYIDRGSQSKEVIQEVMTLSSNGAIVLRGNHEQMFLDWLDLKDQDMLFAFNGGIETMESFFPHIRQDNWDSVERARMHFLAQCKSEIDFIRRLPLFYETNTHIFVHAGINPVATSWRASSKNVYMWIRDEFIHHPHNTGKTVVFGHTPTMRINPNTLGNVWHGEGKIGIDGGCCFGHQMNCLEITAEDCRAWSVPSKGGR